MSVGLSAALSIMAVAEEVEVAVCRDASHCSASATSFLSLMMLQILKFSQQLCFLITLLRWFTTSSHGLNRTIDWKISLRSGLLELPDVGLVESLASGFEAVDPSSTLVGKAVVPVR